MDSLIFGTWDVHEDGDETNWDDRSGLLDCALHVLCLCKCSVLCCVFALSICCVCLHARACVRACVKCDVVLCVVYLRLLCARVCVYVVCVHAHVYYVSVDMESPWTDDNQLCFGINSCVSSWQATEMSWQLQCTLDSKWWRRHIWDRLV